MEQRRTILLVALLIIGLFIWSAWEKQFPPASSTSASATQQSAVTPAAPAATNGVVAPTTQKAALSSPIPTNQQVTVKTDLLDVTLDTAGGTIVRVALPQYPLDQNTPNVPFVLLNDQPETQYTASNEVVGTLGGTPLPSVIPYQASQSFYALQDGQNNLDVVLTWKTPDGLTMTKTYGFTRGSYVITVSNQVINHTQKVWTGHTVAELSRIPVEPPKSMFVMSSGLTAAYSTPDKPYDKLKYSSMESQNLNQTVKGGWVAMTQRYFLSSWIPDANQTSTFYSRVNGPLYTIGWVGQQSTLSPGQATTINARFYAGPEDSDILKTVAPGLDLTLDYGWLWFISMALFWLMKEIYSFVGNWGWSIIFVTLVIKALFYPLSQKSYRSMAQMRRLQPKLLAMRERFGDDKQKMSQATMELYRSEKVNPLSGCLPILVQIPVFIALYWVLIDSVQLRQAPFMFWIHDLSVKDPYYILPIIMGITMYIQQMLNPAPPDPMQAKLMKLLPIMFTFFFLHFPAGLVIYWIVNNVVSIIQQWFVNRKYGGYVMTAKNVDEIKAIPHESEKSTGPKPIKSNNKTKKKR